MAKKYLVLIILIAMGTGCEEEKTCVAPPLLQNIIGNWNAVLLSNQDDVQEVNFTKDNTFKESNGLLFGTYYKSEDTWKVKNDSLIIQGKFTNKSVATYELSMITNSCNEIVLDMEGLDQLKLTRIQQ